MLSVFIGLVLLIIIFIATTGKLKSENATLTFHLENYKDKVNSLEDQIEEYQKMQNELNSQNIELQNSLNEANDWNQKIEIQLAKNITANEVKEEHYGNYQGNDDFSDIINDNHIDKDYWIEYYKLQESENTTTLAWGALETKYTIEWEKEVDTALSYLYNTLSEQDSKNLKQAQISWQKFMNDDENFVGEKYIFTRFFGSQGLVKLATVRLHRTRERAIELMEFIFSIDRDAVDFVYDN
jgi:uncharacterized protein YecT (DUF1311 family)